MMCTQDEAWEQTLRDHGSISGPPRAIFNIGWGACRTANSIELDRLRAENATLSESVTSQALLIASLKDREARIEGTAIAAVTEVSFLQHDNAQLTQQLSDTQRQNAVLQAERDEHEQVAIKACNLNAELMQRVGEADKDAERYRWLRDDTVAWQESDARVALIADEWGWRMDRVIDAAIAASKVSNEVASPRKDETIAYKGDE
jgi:hypothetical protein